MSGMADVCADEESKGLKDRKLKFVLEKVEVLYMLMRGMRTAAFGCHYDVN
jgi:hypothetical protein